jgi:heptosyltransferase-2
MTRLDIEYNSRLFFYYKNTFKPFAIRQFMRILIIKTGALGDVVRTSFIAQALKDKYKFNNPKIFWITQKKAVPFFSNNPYVDFVLVSENKNKVSNQFFDLIVNLEEDEENCRFVSSLKHKDLIGFFYKDGKILPTPTAVEWYNMSALGKKPYNDILKKKNKKTHRQILAEILSIKEYKKYEPFLRLNKSQRNMAKNFLRRHNLSRTELIIGINTGSADRWPKELSVKNTALLIDNIYRKFKAKIILFGGPNEIERNHEIVALSNSPVITAGCGNDLLEFPALISVCSLFITSDTLGLHIALALKRRVIVLVGPTSPSELDLYGLGERVIAKSKCICCYKSNCKSMEKIDLNEILKNIRGLLHQKITLVITAFKEPNLKKCIDSAINQKTNYPYEIIISAPDENSLKIAGSYKRANKNISFFKDPGKGKSFALNLLFKKIDSDILILTDGDVYLNENCIEEICNLFLDPEIGCISGRPFPQESKKTKFGFWAHFLFDSAHKIRKQSFESDSFIECTGYLFAFRKKKIKEIPIDVAEDTVIPYILWQKGYKIGYAEKALVYVKNPSNMRDWIKQKTRTHKSHEKLHLYVDTKTTPKVKTFKTESKGILWVFNYPSYAREVSWITQLVLARLYTWMKYFLETKFMKEKYTDAWERIESTK